MCMDDTIVYMYMNDDDHFFRFNTFPHEAQLQSCLSGLVEALLAPPTDSKNETTAQRICETSTHMYMYMHVRTYMYINVYMYMYINVYMYMYICMYMYNMDIDM